MKPTISVCSVIIALTISCNITEQDPVDPIPWHLLSGRIVFSGVNNFKAYIYTFDIPNKRTLQLTTGSACSWSPDGVFLAILDTDNPEEIPNRIRIVQPAPYSDSGYSFPSRKLSPPAWSPTGEIGFTSYPLPTGDASLYINDQQVFTSPRLIGTNVAFTPDNQSLVLTLLDSVGSDTGQLYKYQRIGGSFELFINIIDTTGFQYLLNPEFSHDGRSIVFERSFDHRSFGGVLSREIWVADSSGSILKRLTSGSSDTDPTWSPDDSKILFSRKAQLFMIDTTGNNLVQISEFAGISPSWTN